MLPYVIVLIVDLSIKWFLFLSTTPPLLFAGNSVWTNRTVLILERLQLWKKSL